MGEIGQQVERTWGDKEWVRRVLERVVNYNEQNLPIVVHWMLEYKYAMNIYMVLSREKFISFNQLPIKKFLEIINRARSAATVGSEAVREVNGCNIYVVNVSAIPLNILGLTAMSAAGSATAADSAKAAVSATAAAGADTAAGAATAAGAGYATAAVSATAAGSAKAAVSATAAAGSGAATAAGAAGADTAAGAATSAGAETKKIIRLGKLWSTRKRKVRRDFID